MEAVGLFFNMVLSEYVPDRFTFGGVISACAEKLLNLGQQLHSWVIRTGFRCLCRVLFGRHVC